MLGTNQEIRKTASRKLAGYLGLTICATMALVVLDYGVHIHLLALSPWHLLWFIPLTLPLNWGYMVYFLNIAREPKVRLWRLFDGYRQIPRVLIATVLQILMPLLWALLFVLPGIKKSFCYALVPYLVKDRPDLSPWQLLKESERLMKGHKFKLALLGLSFSGWMLLITVICQVEFHFLDAQVDTPDFFRIVYCFAASWLAPYLCATLTEYYHQIVEDDKQNQKVEA